jgi:hypothetical protein
MSYSALITGKAQFAGLDQGIDFTGPGVVHALGAGVITRLERSGSGWPGEGALLVYQVTDKHSPVYGRYFYVAEDFAPVSHLEVGHQIANGQILGLATGSGRAPGIEAGFAVDAQGQAYGNPSEGHSGPPDPQATALDTYIKAASKNGGGGLLSRIEKAVTNPNPLENPLTDPLGAAGSAAIGAIESGAGSAAKAVGIPTPEGIAKGAVETVIGWIAPEALKILLYAVFVFGAIALMGYGIATMISPRPPSLRKGAARTAELAAVAE